MIRIYALAETGGGPVRYVGQTNQSLRKRLQQHVHNARSGKTGHVYSWLRKLLAAGSYPVISLVEECSQETADSREIFWIENYRAGGASLTNLSIGGCGNRKYKQLGPDAWKEFDAECTGLGVSIGVPARDGNQPFISSARWMASKADAILGDARY